MCYSLISFAIPRCSLECGGCEGRSAAPLHSRSVRGDKLNFQSPRPTFVSTTNLQHFRGENCLCISWDHAAWEKRKLLYEREHRAQTCTDLGQLVIGQ